MSEQNTPKKILEGTTIVAATSIAGAILGFATSALIARKLGVGDFGNFSLIIAIFGIVLLFPGLGVGTEASRLISKFRAAGDKKSASSVIKSAVAVTLATALPAAIFLFTASDLIAGVFHKDIGPGLRIAAPMVVFAGFMALFITLLQGLRHFLRQSLLITSNNLIKLAAVLLLIGLGTSGTLYAILAAYIAAAAIGTLLLWEHAPLPGIRPYPYKDLLTQGMPIFLFSLFVFLTGRVSMYLLGMLSGSSEVGIYGGALMFSQAFFILPDALATVLLPALSSMYGCDKRFPAFLTHSLKFGALAAFPLLVYIGIFAPQLVGVMIGKSYAQSATVLRIMILTGMTYLFYTLLSTTIVSSGRQKQLVGISIAGVTAVALAGLLLIPRFGANGAAMADATGYLVMSLAALRAVRSFVRSPLPAGLAGVILSNLLFGAVLWYGRASATSLPGAAALSLLGAAIYAASLKISGAIGPEEMAILKNLLPNNKDRAGQKPAVAS